MLYKEVRLFNFRNDLRKCVLDVFQSVDYVSLNNDKTFMNIYNLLIISNINNIYNIY